MRNLHFKQEPDLPWSYNPKDITDVIQTGLLKEVASIIHITEKSSLELKIVSVQLLYSLLIQNFGQMHLNGNPFEKVCFIKASFNWNDCPSINETLRDFIDFE